MVWNCVGCGKKLELGIEELYIDALLKEVGCTFEAYCPVCSLKRPSSPYSVEEGIRILEIMAQREVKGE